MHRIFRKDNTVMHSYNLQGLLRNAFMLAIAVSVAMPAFAQSMQQEHDSLRMRKRIVNSGMIGVGFGSYVALDQLWYRDYPRTRFHSFNDADQWMQVDKCGHAFTAFQLGAALTDVYAWSGYSRNRSLLLGSATSLLYMTSLECLDARSAEWGFSWSDMLANCAGVMLYATQEKYLHSTPVQFKFSYTSSAFANENPNVLGRNFQQRLLKDYNAQTYWLSCNVSSIISVHADFPRWLNVAFGYGATNMLHAKNDVNSVNNFQHTREFYLSFDADLNRVRCKKIFVKRLMRCLSFIKLPSPTLEIQNDGQMKFHFLFF